MQPYAKKQSWITKDHLPVFDTKRKTCPEILEGHLLNTPKI